MLKKLGEVITLGDRPNVCLSRVVERLRAEGRDVPDHLLRRVSSHTWEHINFTGIYGWTRIPQRNGSYRRLRAPAVTTTVAA
jgi:hypothetical protein